MDFKKILVGVDASENSERAVSYVGDILGNSPDFLVQLLAIERPPERDFFADEDSWKKACKEHEQKMYSFLKKSRSVLESKGFPASAIKEQYIVSCRSPIHEQVAYCSPGTSIAQEILKVQEEQGFGTVVVGRRGVSKAEEFLFGSVSNRIVHYAKDCSIWVVQ